MTLGDHLDAEVVHVAGPLTDDGQLCQRCGAVLLDWGRTADPISVALGTATGGFTVGAHVAKERGGPCRWRTEKAPTCEVKP